MATYTIHTYNPSPSAAKALIAAKFGGVNFETTQDFKMGVDNKTEQFLKWNPLGKVPTMTGAEGPLFESNAIARYAARIGNDAEGLLGKGAYEQSVVDQWIEFSACYLNGTVVYPLFAHLFGWGTYNAEKFEASMKSFEQIFGWLEAHFNNHPEQKFLVNNRITLADIIFACVVSAPLKLALHNEFRSKFPKVEAYLHAVYANEHIKSVLGEQVFCAEPQKN